MPSTCPKCQSRMEEGIILDTNYGSGASMVGQWVEGKPEKSMWTGLKLKGRKKYDIRTDRCTRCGFLESYAS